MLPLRIYQAVLLFSVLWKWSECLSLAYNLNSPMLNFETNFAQFSFNPSKHPYFITLALYFSCPRERRRVYPRSCALISAPDLWPVRTRKWAINNETSKCFYFILFTSAVTLLDRSLYSLSVVVERVSSVATQSAVFVIGCWEIFKNSWLLQKRMHVEWLSGSQASQALVSRKSIRLIHESVSRCVTRR